VSPPNETFPGLIHPGCIRYRSRTVISILNGNSHIFGGTAFEIGTDSTMAFDSASRFDHHWEVVELNNQCPEDTPVKSLERTLADKTNGH
jgi:hypothetical protein